MSVQYIYFVDEIQNPSTRKLAPLLGGKGAGLAVMNADLRLPVPPAFIITTDAFRRWSGEGSISFLEAELQNAVNHLELRVNRRFGADVRPLVVSVRSGAPVSMPGMMDTILDLGLNDLTEKALTDELGAAAARDAHNRFRVMFRKTVGREPEPDPWSQLRSAILAVFASWDGERAKAYRSHTGLSNDLGTAVIVQAMVFGTAPGFSGTGVVFTRDPSTGEPRPTGDWLANAQGEDVVSGARTTRPIEGFRDEMPEIWANLLTMLDKLEQHYQDLCDVEFTVESGRLWLLQTRVGKRSARAAIRIAVDRAQDPRFAYDRTDAIASVREEDLQAVLNSKNLNSATEWLSKGIPASPGVVSGKVYLTSDDAVDATARGETVILVRTETSPADILGMEAAVGILTLTGGLVSHAAIVAREWGKAAVVGANEIKIDSEGIWISGKYVPQGQVITIDGTSGKIFLGAIDPSSHADLDPAVSTLISWATDLAGRPDEDPVSSLLTAKSSVRYKPHRKQQ